MALDISNSDTAMVLSLYHCGDVLTLDCVFPRLYDRNITVSLL